MWFQQPDAFTLVQFRLQCGPDHLLKWFERSDLYPSRKHFRGHLHLVFSGSAIRSEKTHEVTRCKQPHRDCFVFKTGSGMGKKCNALTCIN